jgi:GAF domain-containing protein
MNTVSAERLAKIFVEVADTLIDEFDLLDFLHMLVSRASDLVEGSTVGILFADQKGALRFMAASTESTKLLELFQLQNKEGPCMDAFRTGTLVIDPDLRAAATRWPLFAPHAAAAGFRSVHAFPLRLRREVIGVLNVFGPGAGVTFDEADVEIMQALTDLAAISLLQERSIHRAEVLTEQLQGALNSRIAIEQAKGTVAQARGVGVDEAFTLIREYARRGNHRISDLAHTIVTDLAALPELAGPPADGPPTRATRHE